MVIELKDYNGQPNDTHVSVGLYASQGVMTQSDAAPAAKWDGTDLWTIDEAFVLNPPDGGPDGGNPSDGGVITPNHFDSQAYVSGGVLVMHLSFVGVRTPATALNVQLTGGIATGNLVPTGTGCFSLRDAQISGRWSATDVLSAFIGALKGTLCPGSPYYDTIKGQICAAADVTAEPSQDNKGASCDALSLALAFTADPALIGPLVRSPTARNYCDGAPPDNCTTP
jgi:hypothetical protein